jgi:hypothetical protein
MTAEELAKFFHETYLRLAPRFGYKDVSSMPEELRLPWEDVPDRQLMIAVFGEVLKALQKPSLPPIPIITTYAELAEAQRKGEQVVFTDDPSDTMQDMENLRESVTATPAIPLHPVETPIRDDLLTREAAERVANAALARYAEQGIESLQVAMQSWEGQVTGTGALHLVDLGGYQGAEALEVLREEQEG